MKWRVRRHKVSGVWRKFCSRHIYKVEKRYGRIWIERWIHLDIYMYINIYIERVVYDGVLSVKGTYVFC